MTTRAIPLADLQDHLPEVIEGLQGETERVIVTQQGRAEAVLLSADDFEGLIETLEILSDSELVRELIEAEAEFTAGGGHSLEDVRKRLQDGHRQALKSG
jgi:prevent-host-death family protein